MRNENIQEVMEYLQYHSSYKVGMVYDFVTVCSAMANISKEYAPGISLTIVEARVVMEIVENPGITASQLCRQWKRTRSTLSQSIKKLKQKNLITTGEAVGNQKIVPLYATDLGVQLNQRIMKNKFDDKNSMIEKLLERGCSLKELETFYRVMKLYTEIVAENPETGWQDLITE